MDEAPGSPVSGTDPSVVSVRDISDFSKDELLAHIDALEMEISGKEGIIQSLQGDLSVSNDQIMSIPPNYRLRLETTVTEQNLTIEALREELELKQSELLHLNDESFSLKEDARCKISELKDELQKKKEEWEQEKKKFKSTLENVKTSVQSCTMDLESQLSSEINKNILLEKQMERLLNRLEELYQRDIEHGEALVFYRNYWENKIGIVKPSSDQAEKPFSGSSPDYVDSLRNQLADSLTKNVELEMIVQSLKKKTQLDMEKYQNEIDSLSFKLDQLKKTNEDLNIESTNCQTFAERLRKEQRAELNQLNDVLSELYKVVRCLTCSDDSPEVESGSDDNLSDTSVDLINSLHEKIGKCSTEIDKFHDRLLEMEGENEVLRKEIDLLSRDSEELGQYKEAVVQLRDELEKVKSRSNLLEKDYENRTFSLIKDLKLMKDSFRKLEHDKKVETKRLMDELILVKSNYEEMLKNHDQLPQLTSSYVQKNHREVQVDLPNPQNGCLRCGDFSCLEPPEHSLSPLSKLTIPSDTTPPKTHSLPPFTTSTPYHLGHLKGAGEPTPPTDPMELSLVRWLEKCQELTVENIELKNEICNLNMQMKELQVGANILKEEQRVFEMKQKTIETKLAGYVELKQHCAHMSEKLIISELKISELEDELKNVNNIASKLSEENSKLKGQPSLDFNDSDTLSSEYSRKVSEVMLLKCKVESLTQSNCALLKKVTKLKESKDLTVIRLEEASNELANCRNEIEILLENNVNLSAGKKSCDKELRNLKARLEYLNELRERHWGKSETQSMAQLMHKDVLALCRDAIDKRFECEKLLSGYRKPAQPVAELDARHRIELLMKDNCQLAHEKENLLSKIVELEESLQTLQKNNGCDEGWIQHIAKFELELLREMKEYKEQHARIEEALRSTGNLHDELQMEKNELKKKTIEIAKLEKKLENEKLIVEQLKMELKLTVVDLDDKKEMLQDLKEQKGDLENELLSLQNALETAESKLDWEKQCNALRLKHAELQAISNKVMMSFSFSDQDEELRHDIDLDYHKQVYHQVEVQYAQALQTMKHCLAREFAEKTQIEQNRHKEQIEKLRTIVEEQAKQIENLTSSCIINELTHGEKATTENRLIFENMDKCKNEINNSLTAVSNPDDAAKIRLAFQEYFNYQLFLAQKILQDEHRSQYSIAVNTLEQLHESELKLMKLQWEAESYKDHTKLLINEEHEKPGAPEFFDKENLTRSVPQFILHVILKTYFSWIEEFSDGWSKSFKKQLKDLDNEMRKNSMDLGELLDDELKDKALACANALLSNEDKLVTSAKAFIENASGFKNDLLSSLTNALTAVFDATKTTLEEFKKDNSQLRDVVRMKENIDKLEKEKLESEKQCSAALQLLKSDHDIEVKKLDSILMELQHLNEIGCRADALLKLKDELEDKHKREVEELRMYFEQKVTDLEKNFSEEVFSQHSRKLSAGSSCFDDDSDRDKFAPASSHHCETIPFENVRADLSDLNDLFPANVKEAKNNVQKRAGNNFQCPDSYSCAAKVICRLILDECRGDVEHELIEAVRKQELLEKFTERRKETSFDGDEDLEKTGSTMVSHTIRKVGFECFKCLKNDFQADFAVQITALESLMSNKLVHIQRLLDSECSKLNKLSCRLIDASKVLSAPTSRDELTGSSEEVAKLLKDRVNLEKMRTSLKMVVSDMSQFLCDSENELMQQIREELLELCRNTGDEELPELNAEKRVRFSSNLSAIVQELDSTLCESALDSTVDSSTRFREDIHSCMRRLKLEAAALYKLSDQVRSNELDSNKLEAEIDALREENIALQKEIARIKMSSFNETDSREKSMSYCHEAEAVYGDAEEGPKSNPSHASYLQNKAKKFLSHIKDSMVIKSLEDLLREGDSAIDELQNRCEDLEQQVVVADKLLRSTRQFLEEQAIERESERDEYSREISSLRAQLKEKEKECSAHVRFNAEVDELNKDLRDTADRLAESKEKEEILQTDLKAAIDQVSILRDIVRTLEAQISSKNRLEMELMNKLDFLENELQEKNGTQSIMAHEIEKLRNQSLEDSRGFEQLQALEENIKLKFNSSVIRQFQAQVKEMGKLLDHQTEELERNQVGGASSNSLSSPSEEISIREHIESFNRCKTPEHCPSPVGLPVDEVNKLHEKIVRHARADEVILKKLCDQEIRVDKLAKYAEEVQAERDELNKQKEKLKLQVVEAENKIDYLRHKADACNAAANRDIIIENQKLKESLSSAEQVLAKLKHQVQEKETQLESAEQVIASQQEKLRSMVQCDENALESLRLELVAMTAERNKLEGLVEKYKNDLAKNSTHPTELQVLLSDKNDEIKLLQETLARYQNESGKQHSSRSSKGLRVSFATDIAGSDSCDVSKLRDCPGNDSFHFDDQSHLMMQPLKSSTQRNIEVSAVLMPPIEPHDDFSLSKIEESDEDTINQLKMELFGKEQHIAKLEQQLADYKTMEKDLLEAKDELQSAITAISADKNYYEEKLTSMIHEVKIKDERCQVIERALLEKEGEIKKLSNDIGNLQNLVSMAQGKLSQARGLAEQDIAVSEVSQNQAQASILQKEIGRLTMENKKLGSEIAKISAENDIMCRKIADFMSENDVMMRKLSEMDSIKQTYDSRCSEMESLNCDLERRVAEMTEANVKLKAELSRCDSIRNHLEQTQEHLNSLLSENESLQSTMSNMSGEFERLTSENRLLKESIQSKTADLQCEVARLRSEIDGLSAMLKNEKEEKNELKKKCDDLSADLESFKLEQRELLAEKESLAAENSGMRKKLELFTTSVTNLRGDLSSLKKKDSPYISVLANIDCDEVKKLYLEVSKLISDAGQLEFERNCLQQELAKVKNNFNDASKEAEVGQLSEQISRLESINCELKETNRKHADQLQAEIVKLANEIRYLQTLEQQANEKLAASLEENRRLSAKLVDLEQHVEKAEEKLISEKGLQVDIPLELRRNDGQIFERLKETASHVQPTSIIPPSSRSPSFRELDQAVESALYDKVRTIEDLRSRLSKEESQTRGLRSEKMDLELNMKTLEKINALQEKKLNIMSDKLNKLSNETWRLQLELQNEQTSRVHAENELKTERTKKQSSQMENLGLLENMNARLKLAVENETKLKALVLEKHEQCENAIARLNGYMVMERYKIESENEGYSSSPQKQLAAMQEKCCQLQCEYEKQERLNEDLKSVLARERRTLLAAQERLKSIEGEYNKLKVELRKETQHKEQLLENRNENLAHNRAADENEQLVSLQLECERLQEKVDVLQELNDQWRARTYTPVFEQLKELNVNVEDLARRKHELQCVICDLEKERDFLSGQIAQMREERANMRLSSERMDFAPSVSAKLDIYLGRYFRAESYRKSLVSQKKYLNAVLRGFERSHNKTLSALACNKDYQNRPTFRGVVQAVVATNRMKFLVRKRKLSCESAYLGILRALGFTTEDALAKAGQFDSAGPSLYPVCSNSPPTKERVPCEGARRRRTPDLPHSQYLAALQEVQKFTR